MNKTTYKTAKTIKPYPVKFGGYEFIVPKGSTVSNNTACGCSDSYRFWIDWRAFVEKLTGFKNSMLAHDLEYRGLNIPAEYCEPWPGTGGPPLPVSHPKSL